MMWSVCGSTHSDLKIVRNSAILITNISSSISKGKASKQCEFMFGDIHFFGRILLLIVAVHTQWFRLIHLLWSSTSSVGAAKNTKASSTTPTTSTSG